LWLALAAGLALALHFGTFVPSLSYTSVASATALVCTQPIWAGVIGWFLGERLPGRAWVGVGVCVAGALLITGVDIQLSGDALLGDGLALAGGAFGGVYIVLGGIARRGLSTLDYTFVCYGTSALWLLAVCVLTGVSLAGYAGEDWLRIAGITVFGQLVGHSLFNFVLRSISPTMVALGGLFTVPLAAVLAALALGETPPAPAGPARGGRMAGAAPVINARARAAAVS
jgi:drug/metabolite transporter (DMT)-like permease